MENRVSVVSQCVMCNSLLHHNTTKWMSLSNFNEMFAVMFANSIFLSILVLLKLSDIRMLMTHPIDIVSYWVRCKMIRFSFDRQILWGNTLYFGFRSIQQAFGYAFWGKSCIYGKIDYWCGRIFGKRSTWVFHWFNNHLFNPPFHLNICSMGYKLDLKMSNNHNVYSYCCVNFKDRNKIQFW